MTTNYHHENLKELLLENGLALLTEVGEQQFSLRKLAAYCGVSHMAPYAHYKNKDVFLDALKKHITQQFMEDLQETKKHYESSNELLLQLGMTYIRFFLNHENYYNFLFQTPTNQKLLHALQEFEPFKFFHTTAIHEFRSHKVAKETWEQNILMMWSLVHGLSYSYLNTTLFETDWEASAYTILQKAFHMV